MTIGVKMKTSENGKSELKKREGCKLIAYLCAAGAPTIGTGHTKGVKIGDVITQEQADRYLADDLIKFEYEVNRLVKVHLTQNQFDAIISLVFNIGASAFATSTLLRKLNAGDFRGASEQFLVWNKITVNGVRQVSNGLSKRRQEEKEQFDRD